MRKGIRGVGCERVLEGVGCEKVLEGVGCERVLEGGGVTPPVLGDLLASKFIKLKQSGNWSIKYMSTCKHPP